MPEEPLCTGCVDRPHSCDDCERCEDCGCECTRCPHCNDVTDSLCERCEKCSDCCSCETCSYGRYGSGHRVESTCESCNLCSDHCECYYCEGCDSRTTEVCNSCDHCNDCCSCSNSDAPRYSGKFDYLGTSTKEIPRYVSLELEYAKCDDTYPVTQVCERWKDYCVEDGSLPDEGFEINTNPSRGETFGKHIADVCSSMRNAGADVNRSCGMHVHVDARDLNWHDIYKLALIYMRVEDALFAMQPSSRQSNRYCERVDSTYRLNAKAYKHELLNKLYGHNFPKDRKEGKPGITYKKNKRVFYERNEKYHTARYFALNLHTFFYRGTIEFRHAASTTNTEKATNWGLVCMWIVERASKMTVSQINALPKDSTEALLTILPADVAAFVTARQTEQRSKGY